MKLLKIIAYTLLGYVLYELFRGMKQPSPTRARIGEDNRVQPRRADEFAARVNVTGPAPGRTVEETEDPTGAHMRHVVGRGVVAT